MNRLTTYVHDYPVRNSGVGYPAVVRKLAEFEDTNLSPAGIQQMKRDLLQALIELEEYQELGSVTTFRLLRDKYRRERPDGYDANEGDPG